ncbi:peptidoglycan DD-metalloendopeptidase family protein [Terrarubrum flagellatum]|uniref:peptidoglycan DD-metalloendopeptidase family protein n=1 Tax=Terrirubrum flagellatum TaxID=2895980 RepID=UPI0031456C4E
MGLRKCEFRGSLIRAVSVSVLALAAGACSSDSSRFADNPFSNPFQSSRIDQSTTGSIPKQNAGVAAAKPIATAALPPPPSPTNTQVAQVAQAGQNVINRPGAGTNAAVTGFGANGWTAVGGSQVTLAQGESVNALSNRYGVPAEAIYKANGLSNGAAVAPGTRLTIPVYRPNGATVAQAPAPQPVAAAKPAAHPVQAKKDEPPAKPAKDAPKVVAAKPDSQKPKPVKAKPAPVDSDDEDEKPAPKAAEVKPAKPETVKVAETKPAPAETKVPKAEKTEPQTTGSVPPVAGANGDFRWPARGRIISGFRNNGNDGINIAVPEGTPVKAADEGTVAYAGSELKGYGNLVLVRHANGYVSAYAHNGDLKVKKGDPVKRGQTIATSGQSGNVSSPQLHFEIRKGSTPVDPASYLQ